MKASLRHTRDGFIASLYNSQVSRSKKRGHAKPSYTKSELSAWVYGQVNFDSLYLNWVNSGYSRDKAPSVDRADDYQGYSLSNLLRICTSRENSDRSYLDRKEGLSNKTNKEVTQRRLDDTIVAKYHSASKASRETGISLGAISECANGKIKHARGYRWTYTA